MRTAGAVFLETPAGVPGMIDCSDLDFYYDENTPVLNTLNCRFEKGRIHAVIGPSGCGKTTLLYLAAGLLSPSGGVITVDGEVPRPGRERTAVILQNYGLFPWKSVSANLSLGLKIRGASAAEVRNKIRTVLQELGLSGMERKFPSQLSGGEQQRLAIGRALVLDPDLLLLDEPFSSLDAMTRERLQDRLWSLKKDSAGAVHPGMTIVIVTHSIEEAVYLSDRIHIMNSMGSIYSIDNSSSGPEYRKSTEYFGRCVQVRSYFERQAGA